MTYPGRCHTRWSPGLEPPVSSCHWENTCSNNLYFGSIVSGLMIFIIIKDIRFSFSFLACHLCHDLGLIVCELWNQFGMAIHCVQFLIVWGLTPAFLFIQLKVIIIIMEPWFLFIEVIFDSPSRMSLWHPTMMSIVSCELGNSSQPRMIQPRLRLPRLKSFPWRSIAWHE